MSLAAAWRIVNAVTASVQEKEVPIENQPTDNKRGEPGVTFSGGRFS
jgi:hypothetical protein